MTHASYWGASDGTQFCYRYDDCTDPWQEAPLVVRPDIRGHGESEPGPDSGLTHKRLALDLIELDVPIMLAVPDPDPMVDRSEYARMRDYVRHLPEERS